MGVSGEPVTGSSKRAGPTIFEINTRGERRSAREIPRLVAAGVAITWRAGRRELITIAALEVLSGVGVAVEVVIGRRVLEAVLTAPHTGAGLGGVWPSAVALGVVTAVLGVAGTVLREQQRLLSALTSRYAQDLILDVTCAADLAAFDQPEFHDRAARAQAGVMRVPEMVFGLQGLAFAGQSAGMLQESAMFLDDFLGFSAQAGPLAPAAPTAPTAPGQDPAPDGQRASFGPVTAERVTFRYPGSERVALRDVSLRIEPGEVVALVGANGSGKTTLAKLLAGLYLPSEGRICWDGKDTRDVDRGELLSQAAIVFQDFIRYALSAGDNIALGRHERHGETSSIVRAAERAGADQDIGTLPEGYQTLLGPAFINGTDLSQGQWQRIALARTFFRDAPLVILDEPTAALDAKAEHQLFARISELLAGRAVLLISHRFSTVRAADRIYVLDHGRVTESGTHHDLLAAGGTYAELFTLQASPYQ